MHRWFGLTWVAVLVAAGCTNSHLFDYDGDGTVDDEDCAPENPDIHPGAKEVCDDGIDNDCDTFIDGEDTDCDDVDGDGFPAAVDCDDHDPTIFPGGTEECEDGLDNDCDELTDGDDPDCDDPDGDGYPNAVDCAPHDPAIHPGAAEDCTDGVDNDCDGDEDEDDPDCWDDDADGYPAYEDCDDGDPDIHPGAEEVCDGADNDCNGSTDGEDATDASIWYEDDDGDGYGSPDSTLMDCEQQDGYVADDSDCDDTDGDVHPGATEVCNEVDDDCDGTTDGDNAAGATTWYEDTDNDGQGDPDTGTLACTGSNDQVDNADDCDDTDATVYLGAVELCDGLDNDCDNSVPATETDDDGDGYFGCADDCDDSSDVIFPGAPELCDGEDNDCDGSLLADENVDVDGDGAYACADCNDGDGGIAAGLRVPDDYLLIQDAIDAAADQDVICLDPGTYVETLDFLGKAIHVIGMEGPSSTVIDGNNAGPVVKFDSGEGGDSVLEGVWLQDGGGLGGHGGGVYIDGASPLLVDVHISYNSITGNGGGIYVFNGDPQLDRVQITDCSAQFGAGIYLEESEAVMDEVLILDVAADQQGGGIFMDASFPIIEDLTIGSATAQTAGGGIFAEDSPVILQYAEINQCSTGGGIGGGGVYLLRSDAQLNNVVVADCEAVAMQGGGLVAMNSSPVMSNVVFARNTATTAGGGVYFVGSNGWFDAVKVLGNEATGSGGGLYLDGGTHSLYNMVIHGNSGGIYATGNATMTMANCSITSNLMGMDGGVYCSGCTLSAASNNAFANAPANYTGVDDPTDADGNLAELPLYLSTASGDPLAWDLHLAPTSPLVNAGALTDPDGSASDIGAYGGVHAGDWDLDHDGFNEWWQPGTYDYGNYPALDWDCVDRDPAAYPGSGC